jgi:C-terminal processing protease CtpA/Prc
VSDAEARAGWVLVKSILQGSPAEECCKLQENDRIRKVDGKPVDGLDVESVFKMIRGLDKTDVLLEVSRGTAQELVFSVSLTRKPHASQPPRA